MLEGFIGFCLGLVAHAVVARLTWRGDRETPLPDTYDRRREGIRELYRER